MRPFHPLCEPVRSNHRDAPARCKMLRVRTLRGKVLRRYECG
ncbi:hypothetical protein BDIM_16840 [Brevundimonas diminuta ATCC 11568]|nr:hypothetical protein BDIM_16840 [Brevundimonas diminuta ATCC 11568]